jgi:hypothetical protein
MAYNVKNILVGAAALYLSVGDSVAGTLPNGLPGENTNGAPGTAPAAGASMTTALDAATTQWRHTGFTSEGLEISYEPDYTDVEVDQLLDSAKVFKTGMRVTVNTTFSEASLENLMVTWGQQTGTLSSTGSTGDLGMAAGALGDEPVERALAAVGAGPRPANQPTQKRERVYFARRVLSVDTSAHALRRAEATVFPVSFRLLPDPTAPVGKEYGFVRDRNIT